MDTKPPRPKPTLVSDFSHAAYPYKIENVFKDHLDPVERTGNLTKFREALRVAFVEDYRLFDNYGCISAHIRTQEEFDRVSIALQPDGEIEKNFAIAPEGYDFRKLKNRCNTIQAKIRKSPLAGQVFMDVDRAERALVVIAENKRAYLGFYRMMSETPAPKF